MRQLTKKEAAQTALDLQNACNLGGVTNAAHQVFCAFAIEGTAAANQSAPMKLVAHQIAWLSTGQLLLSFDDYDKVHKECEQIAKQEESPAAPRYKYHSTGQFKGRHFEYDVYLHQGDQTEVHFRFGDGQEDYIRFSTDSLNSYQSSTGGLVAAARSVLAK